MLNKLESLRKDRKSDQTGFTIIEVMIVLAIAGLIILIVFLAVPALQRNSRNTQRSNDSSRLSGLISEYITNHNGQEPAGFGTGATQINLADESFSIITAPSGNIVARPASPTAPGADVVIVYKNAKCSSDGVLTESASSSRSLVVWYGIEGKTPTRCVSAGN